MPKPISNQSKLVNDKQYLQHLSIVVIPILISNSNLKDSNISKFKLWIIYYLILLTLIMNHLSCAKANLKPIQTRQRWTIFPSFINRNNLEDPNVSKLAMIHHTPPNSKHKNLNFYLSGNPDLRAPISTSIRLIASSIDASPSIRRISGWWGRGDIWPPLSIETARRRRAAAGADLTRGRRLEFRTTGWKLAGIRLPGANYATH